MSLYLLLNVIYISKLINLLLFVSRSAYCRVGAWGLELRVIKGGEQYYDFGRHSKLERICVVDFQFETERISRISKYLQET